MRDMNCTTVLMVTGHCFITSEINFRYAHINVVFNECILPTDMYVYAKIEETPTHIQHMRNKGKTNQSSVIQLK